METPLIPGRYEIRHLRKAALIAGLAVLFMAVTVPWVEFYIFPTLIEDEQALETVKNITGNRPLFSAAIFIHFLTIICDIVSAWALYLFFQPTNKNLSLLAAWFRLVNAAFTVAALSQLVQVVTDLPSASTGFAPTSMADAEDISHHLRSFDLQWRFMLIFFGLYMNLLGILALKSPYVPNFIAICLFVAGLGYMIENLKHFFYPAVDTGFLWFTFFGELVFIFWLLIKGVRIQESKLVPDTEKKT